MKNYEPNIGDVWRKDGPCDWVKIKSRQVDGFPEYDGAARGFSVVFTNINGNWKRQGWFIPCKNAERFSELMGAHHRTLVQRNTKTKENAKSALHGERQI